MSATFLAVWQSLRNRWDDWRCRHRPYKFVITYRDVVLRPDRTMLRERLGVALSKTKAGAEFLEFEARWEAKNRPRSWRRNMERWTISFMRPERHLIIHNFTANP